MVNINDASRIGEKLARQWEMLENANIDARDRDAITTFIDHRREREQVARSTRRTDLSVLRNASERATVPLMEMGDSDVTDLFDRLTAPEDDGGYGLDRDGSGMFDYCRGLRVFFKWTDRADDRPDYPFWKDIDTPARGVEGAVSEDTMLSPDEIEQLKDAANSPRDRALIAFLADVGVRVKLLAGLRVGHLHDLSSDEPFFVPNPEVEDGHKTVEDGTELPVLHARAELRSWVNIHHPDSHPDAPLWPVLRGYDADDRENSALGDAGIRGMLERCADRAGIEKPANPHHFRRVALTRMSNSDRLTPQEVQHVASWADQRMLRRYDLTSDAERNSAIQQQLGFSDGDADESTAVVDSEPTVCDNCRESLSGQRFCPNCGAVTDPDAQRVRTTLRADARADHTDPETTADQHVTGEQVRAAIESNPDVLAAVADAMTNTETTDAAGDD